MTVHVYIPFHLHNNIWLKHYGALPGSILVNAILRKGIQCTYWNIAWQITQWTDSSPLHLWFKNKKKTLKSEQTTSSSWGLKLKMLHHNKTSSQLCFFLPYENGIPSKLYHQSTLNGVSNTLLSTLIIWNLVICEDVKQS